MSLNWAFGFCETALHFDIQMMTTTMMMEKADFVRVRSFISKGNCQLELTEYEMESSEKPFECSAK